ncbi:twin-arginine translocation signal domain-containing protein [Streptomyces sp. NBC_00201]|uniref:twin-arginine translocation signal domain-containing protein n=1 Tax=unclassified Streptomyces TaxID=2593676 RepID=UPI0022580751|nr:MULTISPECIES: twin-arginine translocation signal domain-containing protein [unclassified Streptomyces]MCX5051971.1 twin-arginine translocation signal domain-containing protein [Streptomyces sp. NBC_00474]MCX5062302.1 twin-arginine translocation signal domain-containing protein [Streptomyces sp. NBC_00452]MCX5249866.1 twin-arginine translocation signal domain-containing protein [Streptomyces sp. NBC_00201]
MRNEWNRRRFVGRAAVVAGAAAMAPALSACGERRPQQTDGSGAAGLKATLPAHVPGKSLQPDIRYPSGHLVTVSGVPGKGGRYTAPTPAADGAGHQHRLRP